MARGGARVKSPEGEMLDSELGARIAESFNGLSSQERMAFPLEIRKVKGQRITAEGEINGGIYSS